MMSGVEEVTVVRLERLDGGWPARLPIVQWRRRLCVLVRFDDDWGAADHIRAFLAPFRTRIGPQTR